MADSYLGESIKKLGFGLMRLPMIGEEIDMEQTKRMVDTFMEKGFTYFDTAYVYIGGKSEVALKEAVVDRYPRDSFQCATKLPLWDLKEPQEMEKIFQESLDRAGLEYYDFYLLHAMSAERVTKADELGAWDFMKRLKAEGRAKHIGFSFHDTAEALEDILKAHPEMEFVQLQINYVDWESESVQSRKCYEVARKYNKPVIIMEPVRGGSLAIMPPQVQRVFKEAEPENSVASWAVRYCASLEGIVTVLSGMSTEEQLNDNVSYMENFRPLNEGERATVQKVVDILNSLPTIPCTACKYCVDGCPQKINIPGIFKAMNDLTLYNNEVTARRSYDNAVGEGGKAGDCIQCGACEAHCPQKIEIIETLKKAAETFA
ncbi:MAG TPA: aldo/keto reductase [Candidatus Acutalibacter pullicola]|uniref:Aldo/keto reductase n=1 Tax=Candidatus Acutalibacter pullicola TaxID=2838417 RepID=A0A9D2MWP4_9FIRM|nr:aldo/keto reductase [Candidatus Acutalibacter pullicola]